MKFKLSIRPGMFPDKQYNYSTPFFWSEIQHINFKKYEDYLNELTKEITVDPSLADWTLLFIILLGGRMHSKEICIYKRGRTYVNDKEKEVSINISLPTSEEVPWGIKDKSRFNEYAHRTTEKGVIVIPVHYEQFENMNDYIEQSLKAGLTRILDEGITLKGYKIKR